MNIRTLAVIILGLVACLLQCSSSTGPKDDPNSAFQKLLDLTPRPDREAELAALWLSGELVAPESLYLQIRDAYSQIRSDYADVPLVSRGIEFAMREVEGNLIIDLNADAIARIRAGVFTEFDSLNTLLRIERVDTSGLSGSIYPHVKIYFKGRLHPRRLIEMYSQLDGVLYADTYRTQPPMSNFYPWYVDGELVFLLYYMGSPSFIMIDGEQYCYFKPDGNGYNLVGTFILKDLEIPEWWDEIKYAHCAFMGYDDEVCDIFNWFNQYRRPE